MEIVAIKEYTPAYHQAIQLLINELVHQPVPLTASYLKELIESENSHLFLLKDEGNIRGMYTLGIYKSPTGTKAWIEDVVVASQYRGKGYGRLLMEHAISFARSLDIRKVMLTSNPSRVAANELYKKAGFEQRLTNVYLIDPVTGFVPE